MASAVVLAAREKIPKASAKTPDHQGNSEERCWNLHRLWKPSKGTRNGDNNPGGIPSVNSYRCRHEHEGNPRDAGDSYAD